MPRERAHRAPGAPVGAGAGGKGPPGARSGGLQRVEDSGAFRAGKLRAMLGRSRGRDTSPGRAHALGIGAPPERRDHEVARARERVNATKERGPDKVTEVSMPGPKKEEMALSSDRTGGALRASSNSLPGARAPRSSRASRRAIERAARASSRAPSPLARARGPMNALVPRPRPPGKSFACPARRALLDPPPTRHVPSLRAPRPRSISA